MPTGTIEPSLVPFVLPSLPTTLTSNASVMAIIQIRSPLDMQRLTNLPARPKTIGRRPPLSLLHRSQPSDLVLLVLVRRLVSILITVFMLYSCSLPFPVSSPATPPAYSQRNQSAAATTRPAICTVWQALASWPWFCCTHDG